MHICAIVSSLVLASLVGHLSGIFGNPGNMYTNIYINMSVYIAKVPRMSF